MRTAPGIPPLGSAATRVMDTRVIAVFCLLFTVLALPWSLSHPDVLVIIGATTGCGLWLLLRAPALSVAALNSITALGVLGTACAYATPSTASLAASACVSIVLQVSALRSPRQAWAQLAWMVITWMLVAVYWPSPTRRLLDLLPILATLVLLTAVTTQVRRYLDRLLDLLHHQANHDPLTELLNRQGLNRRLHELGRAADVAPNVERGGTTGVTTGRATHIATGVVNGGEKFTETPSPQTHVGLGVMVIDIDHFKAINDRHGHLAGDQALVWLSGLLRGALPAPALLARFGGEEFLAVLPNYGLEEMVQRAEQVRALVDTTSAMRSVAFTVSIGAAVGTIGTGRNEGGGFPDFEHVFGRADEAMYAAKSAGRNRVYTHQAAGPAASAPTPDPIPAPCSAQSTSSSHPVSSPSP